VLPADGEGRAVVGSGVIAEEVWEFINSNVPPTHTVAPVLPLAVLWACHGLLSRVVVLLFQLAAAGTNLKQKVWLGPGVRCVVRCCRATRDQRGGGAKSFRRRSGPVEQSFRTNRRAFYLYSLNPKYGCWNE